MYHIMSKKKQLYIRQLDNYLNLLLDPSSNVAAVLAGHLHFRYEGKITDAATQYIFNPAYSGEIAVFTVTGE